ncbi:MAG: tRNA (guanosine(37)-N1)-methyltransferase TrmD [Eubacteriales bacterium]|nr:tRNA (guanosine(37)-N1)-methyltransferase TrmD [Eubacteriales bacterium]
MRIEVLTIFPEMFEALNASILARAREIGAIDIRVTDIRPFSNAKHKNTDDYPFGGGAGMLMTPQPIADAIKHVSPEPYAGKRLYMTPRGKPLNQAMAEMLAKESGLTILCGHYEGVDERVIERYIDLEISIGDYVLTGGELPTMVLIDCVARLKEGVLGCEESAEEDSFSLDGLLEYPQYTRPREFEGMAVPEVLLNGNHAQINAWRREQSLLATLRRRPDLLDKARITNQERAWLLQQPTNPEDSATWQ